MLTRIGDNITKKDTTFINGSMVQNDAPKPVLLQYEMSQLAQQNKNDPLKQEENIRILNDQSEFTIGEQ